MIDNHGRFLYLYHDNITFTYRKCLFTDFVCNKMNDVLILKH